MAYISNALKKELDEMKIFMQKKGILTNHAKLIAQSVHFFKRNGGLIKEAKNNGINPPIKRQQRF